MVPGARSKTKWETVEHQIHNGKRDEHITSACCGYARARGWSPHHERPLSAALLPVIRDRRCSIGALDLVHHLRALAIVAVPLPVEPCRVLPTPKHHRSKQKRSSPWVLTTSYDLCDATEAHHAMALVGAGGGTTIGMRRRWWWLQ